MQKHLVPRVLLVVAAVLGTATTGLAAEPVGPALTPKLLDTLREEMRLVLEASGSILTALVYGDHATVAARAQAIHDSFILDQALTAEDRADLEAALPPAFVEIDTAFHRTAAELAAAARAGDAGREVALFGQMVKACADCHGRFAADRFPGLASK
jgi:mono/diheme cytochrome c family protein